MSGRIVSLLALMFISTAVHAQEMTFESVPLPINNGEVFRGMRGLPAAGDRKLFLLEYASRSTGVTTRYSLVGVKGKEVQVLFNPYRDARPPYYTDLKFLKYGSKVVVTVRNAGDGIDSIWVTDGTTAGTQEVSNEDPGSSPSIVRDALIVVKEDNSITLVDLTTGSAHVLAGAAAGGYDLGATLLSDGRGLIQAGGTLYVTDGTPVGSQPLLTGIVDDGSSVFFPSSSEPDTSSLRVVALSTSPSGGRVAVTDGTPAGTHVVSKATLLGTCPGAYRIQGMQLGNRFVYSSCTPEHGAELWALDLETLQASEIKDIFPGSTSSSPLIGGNTRVNNRIYFMADDGEHGTELWVTDGTTEGTHMTRDIAPGAASSVGPFFSGIGEIPSAGEYFPFIASDTGVEPGPEVGYNEQVWATDGTEAGTFKVSSSYLPEASLASSDQGVLLFPVYESFGVKFQGESDTPTWQQGTFIKVFDPVIGPPATSFLATRVGTGEILHPAGPVMGAGDYYYMAGSVTNSVISELLVGSKVLCPGADFKLTAGQCGCGVEEVPADSSGTIASTPQESDGSAVCLTPIGPIFVPKEFTGTVTGELTQQPGQPDAMQINLPSSVLTALQTVVSAPQRTYGASDHVSALAGRVSKGTVQHQLKLILVDGAKKTSKSLTLRKGKSGRFTVKFSRRLQKKQKIAFQYAVAVTKQSQTLVQSPYVKGGAVRLRRRS